MLRAITSISLIFIFLYSSGFYFFVFKTQQYIISKEIREELREKKASDEDIVIIKVNPTSKEILWVEEDEFVYKGELYDLLNKTESNNVLCLYGFHDDKEGELLEFFKTIIDGFTDNGKAKANNFSFLKDYQIDNVIENAFKLDQRFFMTKINYFDFQFLYNSITARLSSPPPEFSSLKS